MREREACAGTGRTKEHCDIGQETEIVEASKQEKREYRGIQGKYLK